MREAWLSSFIKQQSSLSHSFLKSVTRQPADCWRDKSAEEQPKCTGEKNKKSEKDKTGEKNMHTTKQKKKKKKSTIIFYFCIMPWKTPAIRTKKVLQSFHQPTISLQMCWFSHCQQNHFIIVTQKLTRGDCEQYRHVPQLSMWWCKGTRMDQALIGSWRSINQLCVKNEVNLPLQHLMDWVFFAFFFFLGGGNENVAFVHVILTDYSYFCQYLSVFQKKWNWQY